jgi:hypothetical protein
MNPRKELHRLCKKQKLHLYIDSVTELGFVAYRIKEVPTFLAMIPVPETIEKEVETRA